MTTMTWFQQGDVSIKPAVLPKGLPEGSKDLVKSRVTGHSHTVVGPARVFDDGTTKYIDAPEGFELTHQEHKTLQIPAGTYVVGAIQEYDHLAEEARAVAD